MPLDPDVRAMIDAALAQPPRRLESMTIEELRAGYRERYRLRSGTADPTVTAEALEIPAGDRGIPARLYRPAGGGELPLALYFHGGGFSFGDADAYDLQSRNLAALARCLVLFVDYRLAPEHRFPAALEDALAAVRWGAANAGRLGAGRRLVTMGDSAGGNLALNCALHLRDGRGPRIDLQCLFYPWVDFRPYAGGPSYPSVEAFSTGFFLERAVMEMFVRNYLADPALPADPRVSPLLAESLRDLPPTLVLTAENDPLRDMGAALAERLAASGVPTRYRCAPGLVHNFLGHAGVVPAARAELEWVAGQVRGHAPGAFAPAA